MRDTPQCVVHNDKLVVFGHARECLGVHEGYQDIWYWEQNRDSDISLAYAEFEQRMYGDACWHPWRRRDYELFENYTGWGPRKTTCKGCFHPAAHQSVQFCGQCAVSLPLR